MQNILIVSGHPDLTTSFANKSILEDLKHLLPSAKFTYLDSRYPDARFDVAAEQQRLVDADIVIMQFPVFWYSLPGLMKKWVDDVFVYGFAHGSAGDKVRGKKFILSFTTGGSSDLYRADSFMEHTLEEFFVPLSRWAKHCGIDLLAYVHADALPYSATEEERVPMRLRLTQQAEQIARLVEAQAVATETV